MFILLLSSIKIDSGVKLAHLVERRMFQSIVLCVWVGFRPIGLCVLTVWASNRDRHLFETQRLLEHIHQNFPAFVRYRRLFETRRLHTCRGRWWWTKLLSCTKQDALYI